MSSPAELLNDLRKELGSAAIGVTDEKLVKFLEWKLSVDRAAERFRAFLSWKRDNPTLFDDTLRIASDPELERVLKSEVIITMPGLETKTKSPLLVGRLRNNDMHDGRTVSDVSRTILYNLDRLLECPESTTKGITILHDLRGFNPSKNADIRIPKTLAPALFGTFPIRVESIFLLNAPWIFKSFFTMVSTLFFPKKMKERMHFIDSLDDIKDIIDTDSLPKDVGGKLEFNVEEWVQKLKDREADASFATMTTISSES